VGGLVGNNNGGTIENSSAAGDVCYEAQEYAPTSNEIKVRINPSYFGGLVGYSNQGTINTSYASGDVIAPGAEKVGGLIGYNIAAEFHTVRQSHATGNVTGYRCVGGLIGENLDDLITESYARGDVRGYSHVGGLVGYNNLGTIERCDAGGEVFLELLVVPKSLRTESLTDNEVTYSIADFSDRENGLYSSENTVLREKIYYPGITGGLAGMNEGGEIIDSYATGNIVFARSSEQIAIMGLGGFVGFNDNGKILESHSTGDIINENNLSDTLVFYMGGLVGAHESGYINDSYSQGEIHFGNVTGKSTIMGCGGLVGAHDGVIIRSHSTGDVIIEGNITKGRIISVGGLLGADYGGEIDQSYTTGDVTVNTGTNGTVEYIGGLAGLNQGPLDSSYATGDVLAQGDYVGGLVGLNNGSVNNTYSRGEVTGNSSVGGFIGHNLGNVTNSYSTGYVTAEYSEYLGGFIGQHTSGNITNSYWYKIEDSVIGGVGNQSDVQGVSGRSAQQMQRQSTYSGWDFANIWYIHPTINDGYPHLRTFINEYPPEDNKEKTTTSTSRTSVGPSLSSDDVDSTDSAIKKVLAGSSVRYDFSESRGPVMGIGFQAKDNNGNVVAKVQVLKEKPADVDEPSGNSYRILSLTVGSEGSINEDNADNILIEFKVSKEWIEENNIDPSTIRMTRYHNGQWQDLPAIR
jgi:PGF-pre-PGF domain-containing protein